MQQIDEFCLGRGVDLRPGVFKVLEPIMFTAGGQTSLVGSGPDQTILRAVGDFESVITADGLRGLRIADLSIEVNAANRPGAGRRMGIFLQGVTGCEINNVRVIGTLGGVGGEAVGICVAGDYNRVVGCNLSDLGRPENPDGTGNGFASDGVYVMGVGNLIKDCTAAGVSDTCWVLEGCEFSGIVNCHAKDSGSLFAITLIGTANLSGNYADNLSIDGYSATVRGGVSVGVIGNGTGNLTGTRLSNITVARPTAATGPAIGLQRTAAGQIVGLVIDNVKVQGGGQQGILAVGEDIIIKDCAVSDTGYSAVQVQGNSRNVVLLRNTIARPRSGWAVAVNAQTEPVDGVAMIGNTFSGMRPDDKPTMMLGRPTNVINYTAPTTT